MKVTAKQMFNEVYTGGITSSPRGLLVREITNYYIGVDYPYHNFIGRKDNLAYIKKEFLWYLKGEPYDGSICNEASIWKTIKQPDGRIFSNYGYYWFNRTNKDGLTGFEWVINCLTKDPDSRQAYIPMLDASHMFQSNKDVVCTKGILFRIVEDKLDMTVNMRSSDLAIGNSIDLPCFSFLHEMVAYSLAKQMGKFHFHTDSLHVYERNFKLMEDIVALPHASCLTEIISQPDIDDVSDLLNLEFGSEFGMWLNS